MRDEENTNNLTQQILNIEQIDGNVTSSSPMPETESENEDDENKEEETESDDRTEGLESEKNDENNSSIEDSDQFTKIQHNLSSRVKLYPIYEKFTENWDNFCYICDEYGEDLELLGSLFNEINGISKREKIFQIMMDLVKLKWKDYKAKMREWEYVPPTDEYIGREFGIPNFCS